MTSSIFVLMIEMTKSKHKHALLSLQLNLLAKSLIITGSGNKPRIRSTWFLVKVCLRVIRRRQVPCVKPLLDQKLLIPLPHRLTVVQLLLMPNKRCEGPISCLREAIIEVWKPPVEFALDGFRLNLLTNIP